MAKSQEPEVVIEPEVEKVPIIREAAPVKTEQAPVAPTVIESATVKQVVPEEPVVKPQDKKEENTQVQPKQNNSGGFFSIFNFFGD